MKKIRAIVLVRTHVEGDWSEAYVDETGKFEPQIFLEGSYDFNDRLRSIYSEGYGDIQMLSSNTCMRVLVEVEYDDEALSP